MPETHYSLICQRAIVDQTRNDISVIGVFEGITVKVSDAELLESDLELRPNLTFLTTVAREDYNKAERAKSVKLGVFGPNGAERKVDIKNVKLDLSKSVRSRQIVQFDSIPNDGDGVYQFCLLTRVRNEWKPATEPAKLHVSYLRLKDSEGS